MSSTIKIVLGTLTGFLVWFVVATAGNLLVRAWLPGYSEAEPTMSFTLPMQFARLMVGAVASIAAGATCALAARSNPGAVRFFAIVLVLFFIPVHYVLWERFPWWYHAVFLISLAPLVVFGATLAGSREKQPN